MQSHVWKWMLLELQSSSQSPAPFSPQSAVIRTFYRSVVLKRELSQKARLSVYRSISSPALTYGHELWVVTERMRSRIQAAEMSFARRGAGLSLRDGVKSSAVWERLLHVERGQSRWFGASGEDGPPDAALPGLCWSVLHHTDQCDATAWREKFYQHTEKVWVQLDGLKLVCTSKIVLKCKEKKRFWTKAERRVFQGERYNIWTAWKWDVRLSAVNQSL